MVTTPGVYKEKIFLAPEPELVTGVPAFLGIAQNAKGTSPQQFSLWPQFTAWFGKQDATGYLYAAVEGFFRNGGNLCYVVPLDAPITQKVLVGALAELESLPEIDLICVPDLVWGTQDASMVQLLQQMVLEHCDRMGNRFAILDPPHGADMTAVLAHRRRLQGTNGALYFPGIKIHRGASYIPPCGHIAGAYARCDREVGVHKAPANEMLEGVVDLQIDLSDADLATLNPETGINCLRVFRGRGIRIWGARTLSQEPIWRYINVRRLFITVGRWIELNLADVVFEPNDYRLWMRISRELTAYFDELLLNGALQGNDPQEAFYVKCDAETNPPDGRENGEVVTEIGLAPTVPNEFIVVRLIHGTTGVSMNPTPSP